jgi:sulfur carrier protein
VKVSVNGDTRVVPDDATLHSVVVSVTESEQGVAVALNDSVVSRAEWPHTRLSQGDRVEVLTAVQGG